MSFVSVIVDAVVAGSVAVALLSVPRLMRRPAVSCGACGVRKSGVMLLACGSWRERAEHIEFLIRDREAKYTSVFDQVFTSLGVRVIRRRYELLGRTRSPSAGSGLRGANAPTSS